VRAQAGCGAEGVVKGPVARRAAQAVTPEAVRCSAWLGADEIGCDFFKMSCVVV
jgi:hypothetical protein